MNITERISNEIESPFKEIIKENYEIQIYAYQYDDGYVWRDYRKGHFNESEIDISKEQLFKELRTLKPSIKK